MTSFPKKITADYFLAAMETAASKEAFYRALAGAQNSGGLDGDLPPVVAISALQDALEAENGETLAAAAREVVVGLERTFDDIYSLLSKVLVKKPSALRNIELKRDLLRARPYESAETLSVEEVIALAVNASDPAVLAVANEAVDFILFADLASLDTFYKSMKEVRSTESELRRQKLIAKIMNTESLRGNLADHKLFDSSVDIAICSTGQPALQKVLRAATANVKEALAKGYVDADFFVGRLNSLTSGDEAATLNTLGWTKYFLKTNPDVLHHDALLRFTLRHAIYSPYPAVVQAAESVLDGAMERDLMEPSEMYHFLRPRHNQQPLEAEKRRLSWIVTFTGIYSKQVYGLPISGLEDLYEEAVSDALFSPCKQLRDSYGDVVLAATRVSLLPLNGVIAQICEHVPADPSQEVAQQKLVAKLIEEVPSLGENPVINQIILRGQEYKAPAAQRAYRKNMKTLFSLPRDFVPF